MSLVIDEESISRRTLGSLKLNNLTNDSTNWKLLKDYELRDPYNELVRSKERNFGSLKLSDTVEVSDYEDDHDIPDAHIDLHDLLADYLKTNKDFLVFVDLLQVVFDDIKAVADVFDHLADVESCVEMLLPKLSYLVNYKYNYNIPDSVNRDIIKRMLWLYDQKATDADVLRAADYGSNDKWVGSTLFLPGAVPDDRTATVEYPVRSLFNHDISAHSRTHRYPDGERYRYGVIIIKVVKLDDDIRRAIREVLPAGLKCYFILDGSMYGDATGGSVDSGIYTTAYEDTLIDYQLVLKDKFRTRVFDGSYEDYHFHYWSGRQILFFDGIIDYIMGVSDLDFDWSNDGNVNHDITDDYYDIPDPKRFWKGVPAYSTSGTFSGKYRYDGEVNLTITQVPEVGILPTDDYYTLENILDLVADPWVHDTQYHQMFIDNNRFAYASYWDLPDHINDNDFVEVNNQQVVEFSEIKNNIDYYGKNGLVKRTRSNNHYLENYSEPFELNTDFLQRLDMGVISSAEPETYVIDQSIIRWLTIDNVIHSMVFDGSVTEDGIRFSGRELGQEYVQVDIVHDPMVKLELILDREDILTDTFDGESTYYGEVRSGLPEFYTDPFEFVPDGIYEMVVKGDVVSSEKFDDEPSLYGNVRSGYPEDYEGDMVVEILKDTP